MLGWSIHVFPANTSGRYDSPDLVCSWQTGLGGTDWLNRMVEERREQRNRESTKKILTLELCCS